MKNRKKYMYQYVQMKINSYGYTYSFKQYCMQNCLYIIIMICSCLYFQLPIISYFILAAIIIVVVPVIIVLQFSYIYQSHRFEVVVGYVEQMMFSFKMTPKIYDCFKVVLPLLDAQIRPTIQKALAIIEEDSEGSGYIKAFEEIEKEYNCSRIESLHAFMLAVEEHGGDYQEALDVLLQDIQSYIKSVYLFQVELKTMKSKIILSMGLSILIAGTMVMMVPSDLFSITRDSLYIYATTLFFVLLFVSFAYIQTRFCADWLQLDQIDDDKSIQKIKDKYYKVHQKSNTLTYIACIVPLFIFLIGMLFQNSMMLVLAIGVLTWILSKRRISKKITDAQMKKNIIIAFPIWLRNMSLALQSMVVPVALQDSCTNAPYILQEPLEDLVFQIHKYPTSVKPYSQFLEEFNIREVANIMKLLYTINSLHKEERHVHIQSLISRNQELLMKSMQLKNENRLTRIGFLIVVPMLLATAKLLVDLMLIIRAFLQMNGG